MRISKFTTLFLFLSLCATASLRADTIDEVLIRYCPENDFKYIGEYFSGKESYSDRVVIRTDANQRNGLYWIVSFEKELSTLPKDSVLFLQYVRPGSPEVLTEVFPLPSEVGKRKLIYAGITDESWAKKDTYPTAWKLILKDRQGKELASSQSYLWEMPEANDGQ